MTARAIWIAGLTGLAALSAGVVLRALPVMESDLQASVDQALSLQGLSEVKADVSGQTVTLRTADTPEARAQLTQAKTALAAVTVASAKMHLPVLPGGALVNSPISDIQVVTTPVKLAVVSPPIPAYNAHSALPTPAASPVQAGELPVIHGDRATVIARAGNLPRVAGDSALEASTVAARSCDDNLDATIGRRQVNYRQGTYDLTPDSLKLINDIYKVVAACPVQVRLTVSGYTDNIGDSLVNQTISQARAQAAADALVKHGLTPDRVNVRGFGGALPVADNATPEGRAKNRRVVFTVNAG